MQSPGWRNETFGYTRAVSANGPVGSRLDGDHRDDDLAGSRMGARRWSGGVFCAGDPDLHDHAFHRKTSGFLGISDNPAGFLDVAAFPECVFDKADYRRGTYRYR